MGARKRIVVTGGSGGIGSAVVRELVTRGHEVINVDRRQAREPLARFVYAHLGEREQVQPVFEGADAVCHLGEISNANVGLSPEQVLSENVRIGSTVLQTAADLPRVIYTSTCQVYGLWEGPYGVVPRCLPFDETQPVAPHNSYALSKTTNEKFANLVSAKHGLSVAVFRLPWVTASELTPEWEAALRQKPTETDGFATYCHVTDVARAFALAVESPRAGYEVYQFSAAEVMSLYPLAERLKAHHPAFPPLPRDWPAFKSPLVTQKALEHFGWEPRWNLLDFYRRKHGEIAVPV